MRAIQGMRAFINEPKEYIPDIPEIYSSLTSRERTALWSTGAVLSTLLVLLGVGAIAVIVGSVFYGRRYMKHHRIPGTLVRYQGHGDWVIVALPDGTEVTAHSAVANLPEGADVVVAFRRHGAFVIAPPVRFRAPLEDEGLIEVVEG